MSPTAGAFLSDNAFSLADLYSLVIDGTVNGRRTGEATVAGYLAEDLMQYYMIESWTRQGEPKRIRFSNGMSLNQMALEIGEICFMNGGKWFEPSSLSRVLSGERLFTADQLDAFCKVLGIHGEARWNLKCVVVQDYIEWLGFDFDLMSFLGLE